VGGERRSDAVADALARAGNDVGFAREGSFAKYKFHVGALFPLTDG